AVLRLVNKDGVPPRRRVQRALGRTGSREPDGDENPALRGPRERELGAGLGKGRSMEQLCDEVVALLRDRRGQRRLGTRRDATKEQREKARGQVHASHRAPAFPWFLLLPTKGGKRELQALPGAVGPDERLRKPDARFRAAAAVHRVMHLPDVARL